MNVVLHNLQTRLEYYTKGYYKINYTRQQYIILQ